ncbi:MAG: hypothetical protein NTZ05_20280, partial [Chloroflexi bacterium]|nr:hypothetical protein [Chloroflexota bacterium]
DEMKKGETVTVQCMNGKCKENGPTASPAERGFDWEYQWKKQKPQSGDQSDNFISAGNQHNEIKFYVKQWGHNSQINFNVVPQNAFSVAVGKYAYDTIAPAVNVNKNDQDNTNKPNDKKPMMKKYDGKGDSKGSKGKGDWGAWSWD